MKQTKLFHDDYREIYKDYLSIMSQYKKAVEEYKAKLNNEVKQ